MSGPTEVRPWGPVESRAESAAATPDTVTPAKEAPTGVPTDPFAMLVGNSPALEELLARCARRAASGTLDLLLLGEAGTGKAMLARALHDASPRSREAFLTVDCSALMPDSLEVDLYGQAFASAPGSPGEREGLLQLAAAGTVFVRRIDLIPPALQPRVLATLSERVARPVGSREAFDVRCAIVASAGQDLQQAVDSGRFREDLYGLLMRSHETVPPLRERRDDIPELAAHFLSETARSEGMAVKLLAPEALDLLRGHPWQGNVRELKRVMRDAFLRAKGEWIGPRDLRLSRENDGLRGRRRQGTQIFIPPTGKTLQEIEGEAIQAILSSTQGNKSMAARILGISRPTLLRKIAKYDLVV